ncbi:hypothetical protein [Actinoplanes sp. URMC 104]|uniref:hypothetical protein n=1 Tax=Actinoplanes sp. URMC 104 TaxID=3423409 RepID=UPI003F1D308D
MSDVILIGGPRDGGRYDSPDAALIQLEIDGLFHRYVRTTATRDVDGEALTVYNYDGVVRPEVAKPTD